MFELETLRAPAYERTRESLFSGMVVCTVSQPIRVKVSLIVAVSDDGVIGKKDKMPWYLPGELKRFQKTTEHHPVIMGSKTAQSIFEFRKKKSLLPERHNIVISSNAFLSFPGNVDIVKSIDSALELARKDEADRAFIIGGGQIYKQVLENDLVDEMIITHVHMQVDGAEEGNVYFPQIDRVKWEVENTEDFAETVGDTAIPYTIATYQKRAAKTSLNLLA